MDNLGVLVELGVLSLVHGVIPYDTTNITIPFLLRLCYVIMLTMEKHLHTQLLYFVVH